MSLISTILKVIFLSSGNMFSLDSSDMMEKKEEFSFFLILNFRLDILPLTVLLFCHIDHNWFW